MVDSKVFRVGRTVVESGMFLDVLEQPGFNKRLPLTLVVESAPVPECHPRRPAGGLGFDHRHPVRRHHRHPHFWSPDLLQPPLTTALWNQLIQGWSEPMSHGDEPPAHGAADASPMEWRQSSGDRRSAAWRRLPPRFFGRESYVTEQHCVHMRCGGIRRCRGCLHQFFGQGDALAGVVAGC